MAPRISYKITPQIAPSVQVDVNGNFVALANVVTFLTHVACIASEGGREVEAFSFKCPVKVPAPDAASFTANPTGADLLAWATAELGQPEIDSLKAQAMERLKQLSPAAEVAGEALTVEVGE